MPRMSLADILIGTTSLTQEQLLRAEALSSQRGVRLEEVLIQQHFLSEEFLSRLLASISWYRFESRMASSWLP